MKLRLKKRLNEAKKNVESIYRKVEELLFRRLPSALGAPLAVLLALAPIALAGYMYYLGKSSHPSSYTVMITNMAGTGGGSGVIVSNSSSESVVLSNKHVCDGALKKGGKIRLVSGEEHLVTGYITDVEHDLCALTVAADLKNSIAIADEAPKTYSEGTITGHPALMPNIITKGHFGGREIISLVVGIRKCKDSDMENPQLAPFCSFFGVVPIIRSYESQVVSATIMGGSSGSAVLNEQGELSGLVFAGNARGLSYAYIVPFEAVKNFTASAIGQVTMGMKDRPWLGEEEEETDADEMSVHEARGFILQKCTENTTSDIKIITFCKTIIDGTVP